MSLPSLVTHFSGLPTQLQSHFLITLLRHSPLPVLRTVHSVLTPILARDFLTLLPPELVSHVLTFLPFNCIARASRVSRSWRDIIDSDPVLWRDLLKSEKLWFGGDSERAFAEALIRRRRRAGLPHPHDCQAVLMSSSRLPTTAVPQSNTTSEFSSILAAVVLLLLSFREHHGLRDPYRSWVRVV